MTEFTRAEEGQAIVVVALAMMVLMGALALAVDWGYGYAARREIQTQVDAATLAAARRLGTTFTVTGGAPAFEATLEDICQEAAGRTVAIRGPVTLSLFSASDAAEPAEWATIATSDCGSGAGALVAPDVVFVRVTATTTYSSLFAAVSGSSITAGASARARLTSGTAIRQLQLPPGQSEVLDVGLSGATTAPNLAIWPIALHFKPSTLNGTSCGEYCGTSGRLVTLWGPVSQPRFGSFNGIVTLGHHSVRESPLRHQIITESDYRGSDEGDQGHPIVPPLPNMSDPAACGGATWDTRGASTMSGSTNCDIPNWFYYGYGGSIGIGTNWGDPSWDSYRGAAQMPSALPTSRASCGAASYFVMPSCVGSADTQVGDWVETLTTNGGEPTVNMALRMLEFIGRYGREDARSSTLGKAVVVHLPMWDCAETYDGTQPAGSRWSLIDVRSGDGDNPDCSQLAPRDVRRVTVDRVHIVTSVPFTFYENLITISDSTVTVKAYWGGVFGDAGSCAVALDPFPASCALNPLMNSAFLVADQ